MIRDRVRILYLLFLCTDPTAKNTQVVTSVLTSCNNLLQQVDIRMRSHRFLLSLKVSMYLVLYKLIGDTYCTM